MNARIHHKHITQQYKPFHDKISRDNGKIRGCKRWRNRKKAQIMWQLSIERYFARN